MKKSSLKKINPELVTFQNGYSDYHDRSLSMNGQFPFQLDAEGNKITRTRESNPYNFQDFVRWVNPKYLGQTNPNTITPPEDQMLDAAYSDRLHSWDQSRFDAAFAKHLPLGSGGFRNGRPNAIQDFLRTYYDDTKLTLVKIIDCCNQATGYEIYCFSFLFTPKSKR